MVTMRGVRRLWVPGVALVCGLALAGGLLLAMGATRAPGAALAQGSTVRYVAPAPDGADRGNDCAASSTPCATVQHAVDEAEPGDEIRVASGVYSDVQARAGISQVVSISKTVTLRGGYTTTDWTTAYPVTQPTTLDARGEGRVLYISGEVSPTVEGLHLTGGDASGLGGSPVGNSGGGVYVVSATLTLSDCRVSGNSATSGGGLFLFHSANATLTGNTIDNNTGKTYAGGLYFHNSPAAMLTTNIISNNVANYAGPGMKSYGGAYFLLSDNATLISNTIRGNRSASHCGGVCFSASDNATLIGNAITGNTRGPWWDGFGAGMYFGNSKNARLLGNVVSHNSGHNMDSPGTILGGGLYIGNASTVALESNTISSNGATRGGGLYVGSNSIVTLTSNVITGNAVYSACGAWCYDPVGCGGGVHLNNSAAVLTNTVIADNQAETVGGGLYIAGSSTLLRHTTIARNGSTALTPGSGAYVTHEGTRYSAVAMSNTILVSQSVGISVTAGSTVTVDGVLWFGNGVNYGGPGNISVTHEYSGDPAFAADGYHLTGASAAIDRGVYAEVDEDIDGDSRPQGGGYDLGADEFVCRVYLPAMVKNGGG